MGKSTRKIIMFIALFSIISSASALIYKVIYNTDLSWLAILGGLACGFILTFLIKSYDSDDDYMPKPKK
ncbi:hypothetical protein [Peptostreptococcus faecalis]|uniref:hypothetical protein n=1 Tax=Peptostreptococcus faecalis TaxID=2045015 RepID=UPI000C7A00CE|nr:hypothetical protein [Peptostreptococcus faecalis]